MKDLNATQAAIRCGQAEKTARQQGSRLLTDADIAAAIAEGQARQLEAAELIAFHLACTDMTVGFSKGPVAWVQSRNRPQVH